MTSRLVLLSLCMAGLSFAQVRRAGETARDVRALNVDRQEKRDDARDANRWLAVSNRFDAARAANNFALLGALDSEIRALLAQELREGQAELARDRAEVRQDNRELRRDRVVGPVARDDRRDRRDDVRDVKVEANSRQRIAAIDAQFAGLAGRFDPMSLQQRRALLNEVMALSRQELRQDNREQHEDRRELREP